MPDLELNATAIVRRRAHTFYLASLFLPVPLRKEVHIVYAYYRMVDDFVDDPSPSMTPAQQHQQLDHWHRVLQEKEPPDGPLMAEIVKVSAKHSVPVAHLAMVLEGARRDIDFRLMSTRDDLIEYSVLVAGSVGMVMARVLGAAGARAETAACDLGVAMQITNIMRDVGEDLRLGRVYLPEADLRRHRCSLEALHRGDVTADFQSLLRELIAEARERYARGLSGVRYLPRRSQFSIYLAATLYSAILDKIEKHQYDVFSRRAHLGLAEKWIAAVPAYLIHRRLRA